MIATFLNSAVNKRMNEQQQQQKNCLYAPRYTQSHTAPNDIANDFVTVSNPYTEMAHKTKDFHTAELRIINYSL